MRILARSRQKTTSLVQLALLTALVIVFQLLGQFVPVGVTKVSLVLLPITLGGILLGPWSGAVLGFIFGAIVVVVGGAFGTDPFTSTLFQAQPFATTAICLVKGTAAGLCGGLVYRLVARWKQFPAVFAAAAIVPIVNTVLFILGGLFLVQDTLSAEFVASGSTVFYFLTIVCAGWNFIFEFLLNIILAPSLDRIIFAAKKL